MLEDLEENLAIFDARLRHMREDIAGEAAWQCALLPKSGPLLAWLAAPQHLSTNPQAHAVWCSARPSTHVLTKSSPPFFLFLQLLLHGPKITLDKPCSESWPSKNHLLSLLLWAALHPTHAARPGLALQPLRTATTSWSCTRATTRSCWPRWRLSWDGWRCRRAPSVC